MNEKDIQNAFMDDLLNKVETLCNKANKRSYEPTDHEREQFGKIVVIINNMNNVKFNVWNFVKIYKKQEEILLYLKKNPNASRKELTETITDLTEDGVKYNLTRLKNLGLIQRVGSDKGGYWRVIE